MLSEPSISYYYYLTQQTFTYLYPYVIFSPLKFIEILLVISKLDNLGNYSMDSGKERPFYVRVTEVNTSLNPVLCFDE